MSAVSFSRLQFWGCVTTVKSGVRLRLIFLACQHQTHSHYCRHSVSLRWGWLAPGYKRQDTVTPTGCAATGQLPSLFSQRLRQDWAEQGPLKISDPSALDFCVLTYSSCRCSQGLQCECERSGSAIQWRLNIQTKFQTCAQESWTETLRRTDPGIVFKMRVTPLGLSRSFLTRLALLQPTWGSDKHDYSGMKAQTLFAWGDPSQTNRTAVLHSPLSDHWPESLHHQLRS